MCVDRTTDRGPRVQPSPPRRNRLRRIRRRHAASVRTCPAITRLSPAVTTASRESPPRCRRLPMSATRPRTSPDRCTVCALTRGGAAEVTLVRGGLPFGSIAGTPSGDGTATFGQMRAIQKAVPRQIRRRLEHDLRDSLLLPPFVSRYLNPWMFLVMQYSPHVSQRQNCVLSHLSPSG